MPFVLLGIGLLLGILGLFFVLRVLITAVRPEIKFYGGWPQLVGYSAAGGIPLALAVWLLTLSVPAVIS